MQEAGLVERRQERAGRGRPGDRWTVAPGAQPSGQPPSAYASLAVWLARAIPAGPTRLREVERTGREIGRELAPKENGDPVGGTAPDPRRARLPTFDEGESRRQPDLPSR